MLCEVKPDSLSYAFMEAAVPENIADYVKPYGEILQSELYLPELRLSGLESLLSEGFNSHFVSSAQGRITSRAKALAFSAAAGSVAHRSFESDTNAEHFTVWSRLITVTYSSS